MNAEVWQPAPFMRPMGGDQELGNIYEMRTYTYQPGSMPELLRRWAESLPYREEFSPLAAGDVHRVRRSEQVDAHLALQGPEPSRRGTRRGQQDSPVAQRSAGAGLAGEQDHDSGQLLADALGAGFYTNDAEGVGSILCAL